MKRLFFVLGISLLLTSCSLLPMAVEEVAVLDYSRYTNQGFFITESNSVGFDYQSVGSIIIRLKNGRAVKGKQISTNSKRTRTIYEDVYFTYYDAIDKAMARSKELDGNGIINMKVETIYDSDSKSPYYGRNVILTGMVIKKLDK